MKTTFPSNPIDEFADLTRFFSPRRVALLGATEDLSKFGGRCMRQLIDFGFKGEIYPVNPNREKVFDLPCYKSLGSLPNLPDHVAIVLPSSMVLDAVIECGKLGIPFATVFSAGFAETGSADGIKAQEQLRQTARRYGLRLMGPNCNGLINFVDAFAFTSTATINGPRQPAGDIGIVGQSGGAAQVNVMWRAQQMGLAISYQVSCGNCADLDMLDYAAFMVDSLQTRVVLILAEHISDGKKLKALSQKALAAQKPLVMVKAGKTLAGSKAAASHTGAITGEDAVFDAALEQLGILRVDDYNELYEVASLLRRGRWPLSNRVAASSISGGNLVMLADLGAVYGLEWPEYSSETQAQLSTLLPGFSSASNPTDLTAAAIGQAGKFAAAAEKILNDEHIDLMIPVLTIANSNEVNALAELSASSKKPVAILWTGCTSDDAFLDARSLVGQGHAVFRDALPCVKAVSHAVRYARFLDRLSCDKISRPQGIDLKLAQSILNESGDIYLSEFQAKKILKCYGIDCAQEYLARTIDEALEFSQRIGTSVALKVISPDILHKTESQAIRLNVFGNEMVRTSYEEVLRDAKNYKSNARIDGVLVQEMLGKGEEMLLGVSCDPTFGPVVTVGTGGIFVEILKDVVHRLPPFSNLDSLTMIQKLKGFAVLGGARSRSMSDIDALAEALTRLSWLAFDFRDQIKEIDVNPIFVFSSGRGVKVADALMVRA